MAEPRSDSLGLERIAYFSDAVIAIAITLLAIDLRLPELPPGQAAAQIPEALLELGPRYFSFMISFLVVGTYWWAHHRVFRVMRRYDETLIWLNILFLLGIAIMPFASSVVGQHGDISAAAIFYALCVAATGLAEAGLWIYASQGHRLIDPDVSPRAIRLGTLRALIPPAVMLLSIPVSQFVSPYAAMATWFAIFPLAAVLRHIEAMPPHGEGLKR
jgi:uncharacterized membrane protein